MILRYSWNACDPKKLHPKHQGNHPPKQFRWETSGWVLQTDLVANLCCRSPGVTDSQGKSGVTQGSCPPRVMISRTFFWRGCLSYVPPENPYLVPPDNPCFTKKWFPTKIPTAHPLLHGFIFSGPWTVVSVSLHMQKGTQGAKFYIPQWPSSTILLRLSDHEKPAFREPQGFLWEPPSTPSFRSFPYHSHTSNKFWIWVAGGFRLLGGSNRRNPLSLKSLLTQKWHYIIGI